MRLTEPRCVKDIQRLNGCITALGRFISKSAKKCMPFFKALKSSEKNFQWDEECSKSWLELKSYLSLLPLVCSPIVGEKLYLYTLVSNLVVASMLIIEEASNQHPIYFVSKVLHDAKMRHSNIKKLVYALVISARKLKVYFESHLVVVYTNAPLKQIFHKLD